VATEAPPKLVVRTYAPARGWLGIAAVVLVSLFALYISYEYGRFDGGYDRLMVGQRETEHEVQIERLEREARELRVQLAELDTMRAGQTRERAEVARSIGELQAQVAKQAQDIAFYRGIVEQGANASEVKIQQLRIAAADTPGRFKLRLTLVQPVRPDNTVSGTVVFRIEGARGAEAVTLAMEAVTVDKRDAIPFTFRYFENIDPEVTIPEGFRPERVTVEVRSSRKAVAPVAQTFIWNVEA